MNHGLNPPQPEPLLISDYFAIQRELKEAGLALVPHLLDFTVWKGETRVWGATSIRDLQAFLAGWNFAQEWREDE